MTRGRGTRAGLSRDAVIASAHDLLVVEGFPALTMRRVAELLGVTPNTLYSHVTDSNDLADAVLDRELSRIALPEAGTTQNRVELVMRALWSSLVARPGLAVHLIERTNWSAELARLRREVTELVTRASSSPSAADHVGAILAYTIGSAAMAGSMGIVSADRIFREGLDVFLGALDLEPAPGRFVRRDWPVLEDTKPGTAR